ncbi:MAG: hypothetical protein K0R47_5163 [Brevibacillus sp.]|jgi:putative transcriptional regulator|nr:hypothetical protein [Brevibacillus sp.]
MLPQSNQQTRVNPRRERFQLYRKKFNVSQRDVSLALGVSEGQVRQIEAARSNPSAELLFKLAKFFDAPPEELFPDLVLMAESVVQPVHQQ